MGRLPARPFLYAILDTGLYRQRPLGPAIRKLAAGGAALLQLRMKAEADAIRFALAREAVAAAHAAGVPLIVDDRPDIALMTGADGVHVGQSDLPPGEVRRLLGPEAIVGVSTHDLEQLRAADQDLVDYVAFGPVFSTTTKLEAEPVVGIEGLRSARKLVSRPLVAIGGVTRANASSAVAAGADGVAVISDLLRDEDLAEASRTLRAALESGR